MVKTIVGTFDDYEAAHGAAEELKAKGFMATDVSILARYVAGANRGGDGTALAEVSSNAATGAVTGGVLGGAAGLAVSLMGLAIPGIGPIIATGPLVAALAGAGAGAVAGGLIGALTEVGVSAEHAQYYAESLRRGGAVVTVRADESRSDKARAIMGESGAFDIDERVQRWREFGWTRFDPAAKPYTPEEAERERRLFGTPPHPLSGRPSTPEEGDNQTGRTIRH